MLYANKTIQYTVYDRTNGSAKYIGDTSSWERPELNAMTDTVAGAGIMGEIDLPALGQLESMSAKLAFKKTNSKFVDLVAPIAHELEVRWVNDVLDSSRNKIGTQANKEFLTVIPKASTLGSIEGNTTNEAEIEFEVLYYNYILEGRSVLEIDKLNQIYKVNGKDYSREIRNAL